MSIRVLDESPPTHASVQILRPIDLNGHSYVPGTLIGNLPIATARSLVTQNAARITSESTASLKLRRTGIEHELPAELSPTDWEAASPVQGQRSSVFINTIERDALNNR